MISIYTNFHVIYFFFNKDIEIINLGVWELLSILKIAFRGISQSGFRPHLFQHVKFYNCTNLHAFKIICAFILRISYTIRSSLIFVAIIPGKLSLCKVDKGV